MNHYLFMIRLQIFAPIRKQVLKKDVMCFNSDSSSTDDIQVIQRTDLNLQTDSESSEVIVDSQDETNKGKSEPETNASVSESQLNNLSNNERNESSSFSENEAKSPNEKEEKGQMSDGNEIIHSSDLESTKDKTIPDSPNKGIDDPSLIEELNSSLIRLPGHFAPKNVIPYLVRRENKLSLHGKRTSFQLIRGGKIVLSSKIKTLYSTDAIHITNDNKYHFSHSKNCGTILIYDNFTKFSLRKGEQFGDEIMTMKFTPPKVQHAPREVELVFFFPPEDVSPELKNRKPKITTAATWSLNLDGRTAKRSSKNCILVDENDKEHIVVLKHHSSELYIETLPSISSLCIFAIGICSFLCKLKSI